MTSLNSPPGFAISNPLDVVWGTHIDTEELLSESGTTSVHFKSTTAPDDKFLRTDNFLPISHSHPGLFFGSIRADGTGDDIIINVIYYDRDKVLVSSNQIFAAPVDAINTWQDVRLILPDGGSTTRFYKIEFGTESGATINAYVDTVFADLTNFYISTQGVPDELAQRMFGGLDVDKDLTIRTDDGRPALRFFREVVGSNGDKIAEIVANMGTGVGDDYGRLEFYADVITDAAEDGRMVLDLMDGGSFAEIMEWDHSGLVTMPGRFGIGVTALTAARAEFRDASVLQLRLSKTSSISFDWDCSAVGSAYRAEQLLNDTGHEINLSISGRVYTWSTAGGERMRLSGAELMSFRTTALASANFVAQGAGGRLAATFYRPINSTTGGILTVLSNVGGTETEVLRIEGDGDVFNINGTYGTISDENEKKNDDKATSKKAKLLALDCREYNLKHESDEDPKHMGLMAQAVQEIFPEHVHHIGENETVEHKGSMCGKLSINYYGLIMPLLQLCQEQQEEIESIKKHVGIKEE